MFDRFFEKFNLSEIFNERSEIWKDRDPDLESILTPSDV